MNPKHFVSAGVAAGVIVAAAYFGGDAFKGVQAAPPSGTTAHRFDHSKVDWKGVQATPNSTSQSVGANDD
jgi:hypothetical protein